MRSIQTALVALVLLGPLTGPARADQTGMCDNPPCTRNELEAYEQRVIKHLLRVQQQRFEAKSRGEDKSTKRYDREFKRTQDRRAAARRAIETSN